ncbi:hypothetical protein OROMI_034917 [Orobanche minor]
MKAAVDIHNYFTPVEAALARAALELMAAQSDKVTSGVEMEAHHEDDGKEYNNHAQHQFPTQHVFFLGLVIGPQFLMTSIRHGRPLCKSSTGKKKEW